MEWEAKERERLAELYEDCDGRFAFIAGYTDGGAPYGVMWEEVGIDPGLSFEEKVKLYHMQMLGCKLCRRHLHNLQQKRGASPGSSKVHYFKKLMDMFAMPYKAVVLRLFESGNISHQQAEKLLEVGSADVMGRVSLTGKAKRWQLDGKGTESFGTLLEKVEYNRQHEYLTESREKEDVAYLAQLKKEYGLD